MQKYYTPDEVAKQLDVSRITVYRWLKSGELESLTIGGRHRITQEQLNKFINKK